MLLININKKPIFFGIIAGVSLLALYFVILTLANSFAHAVEQFNLLWYWIFALVVGFGIQTGLYAYIRIQIRAKNNRVLGKEVAASAGVSTGSMVACCAHHLVDVLPILGLSTVFLFLAQYQVFFIVFGVLSNLVGIIYMLEIIQKHSLYKKTGVLNRIMRFDIKTARNRAILGSAFVFLFTFLLVRNGNLSSVRNSDIVGSFGVVDSFQLSQAGSDSVADTSIAVLSLAPKTNNGGGLSIEAQPIDFSFSKSVRFEISLNTHQGDLDFDLAKKSVLLDDKDSQFVPLEWRGGQGGHHLTGALVFPALADETKTMKLKIFDVYGVKEREFFWDLK